jgi:hypothetical protein
VCRAEGLTQRVHSTGVGEGQLNVCRRQPDMP